MGKIGYSLPLFKFVKQALEIKKNPFPWEKAICAGFCAAIPAFIGLLTGNLAYGMQAGIGGFTYLYVFNEPYAQRAKKLFWVMIGLSLSVGIGTLLAPHPFLSSLMLGLIGSVATFIFGALKIPGPAAVFFVLCFAMTSGMPIDPTLAPIRAGLVLLGGLLSWVIGMAGWLFHPHAPELRAVRKVYLELACFLDAIGTQDYNQARHRTVMQMKTTDDILLAGHITWRTTDVYNRLLLLNHHANDIFLHVIERFSESCGKLPPELAAAVRGIVDSIDDKQTKLPKVRQPEERNEAIDQLFRKIFDADAILNEPVSKINQEIIIFKRPIMTVFGGAFDKNSVVFLSAARYGTILAIAAIVAYSFEFYRSYWIPLSCAAVMLGSTIISTFHRAIQRTLGTIIGILTASIILSAKPHGIFIVLIIFTLTTLTELYIVRNYALAAMFITPNALLIAESSTHLHKLSIFATARITDVLIGCGIGLFGTYLTGRRSASSRLPHAISKTIRSQMQFVQVLFTGQLNDFPFEKIPDQSKMHTNFDNLKIIYTTALGELPHNKAALGRLWPAIFSMEQLRFYLDACLRREDRPILSDESLARLLLIFESMASAVEHKQPVVKRMVPEITGFPKIQQEIADLQNALSVKNVNKQ
ncbi:FUSC family protein [Bacillus sp. S3]|uniref:FUSC family protein n=1 Tax=Bacillus sp. S3 TaxID=486398 RepID=UPI001187F64A|nr:FUSC family protein [Bacillus sp. S3]QCJ42683.1 FUSC family protein [Bacillus sp. S3]